MNYLKKKAFADLKEVCGEEEAKRIINNINENILKIINNKKIIYNLAPIVHDTILEIDQNNKELLDKGVLKNPVLELIKRGKKYNKQKAEKLEKAAKEELRFFTGESNG